MPKCTHTHTLSLEQQTVFFHRLLAIEQLSPFATLLEQVEEEATARRCNGLDSLCLRQAWWWNLPARRCAVGMRSSVWQKAACSRLPGKQKLVAEGTLGCALE